MKPDLYLASVSDVHLGHNKTPTLHIAKNLMKAFPDVESTGELDMVIFGGDLFDQLLTMNQAEVTQALEAMALFMSMCHRRKIHVVFMEGTPSHDWGQNRLLEMFDRLQGNSPYFHYVKDLSIIYYADLDIHVLYVPDEWRPETDDTWKEVRELMREQNLEQVDFTIVHGCFDFQLPDHVKAPRHLAERYQQITRHLVFGAHVHTPSVHGNIRVNGSFDRLAHNEEEAKGHWRARYFPDRAPEVQFIVNRDAMTYLTVECTGMELEEAFAVLDRVTSGCREGSHFRIKANKADPIIVGLDTVRKRYPQYHWTSKVVEQEEVQKTLLVDMRSQFVQVQITPENIEELLTQKMGGMTANPAILARAVQRMKELV
ncbi:hypothetical protein LUCX_70 [Xanthomonas phage vB_XciM_LucasX]|nr:hypothetical protein LUCX_70 [Xanthomonas phage vB_XciM_LucasX]